jgi:hypothetical protein
VGVPACDVWTLIQVSIKKRIKKEERRKMKKKRIERTKQKERQEILWAKRSIFNSQHIEIRRRIFVKVIIMHFFIEVQRSSAIFPLLFFVFIFALLLRLV